MYSMRTLMFSCVTCNEQRDWGTRMDNDMAPFREIIIDPPGPHRIKPYIMGSFKTIKNYLLIIKCLHSAAVQIMLMESMETRDVILALLRLEARYGQISLISRDNGSNMISSNLNQKAATKEEARLFGAIKEYSRSTVIITKDQLDY